MADSRSWWQRLIGGGAQPEPEPAPRPRTRPTAEQLIRAARRMHAKQARRFDAARTDRLAGSWRGHVASADAELRQVLHVLRSRARDAEQNNDYMRRYLGLLEDRVVGAPGMRLQMDVREPNGSRDTAANSLIEDAFCRWGMRREWCSVDASLTWWQVQRLWVRSRGRDGETLLRMFPGADNPFAFSVQMIEPDYLDHTNDRTMPNGNRVRMGIERDALGRPVAYHLLTEHPHDYAYSVGTRRYEIVAARWIVHGFTPERAGQTRGVPSSVSALYRMQMLGGYEESELVAARVSASKMGIWEDQPGQDGEPYQGDEEDEDGNQIVEAEPGTFEDAPHGKKLTTFDPQHPNTAFDGFSKSIIRGFSSGLNVSYSSLSNDITGASFSSLRQDSVGDKARFASVQREVCDELCERVFAEWLMHALLTPEIPLPPRKLDKFSRHTWQPNGHPWVDPQKEIDAEARAVALRVRSRTEIAASQGRDFEEVVESIAAEEALMKKHGIDPALPAFVAQAQQPQKPEKPNKPGGEDGDE